MFGKLKEKLKSWVKKNEEVEEVVETKKETKKTSKKTVKKKAISKKEVKPEEKKTQKKTTKKKPLPKKEKIIEKEPIKEITEESKVEESEVKEEKKSFFGKLFHKKEVEEPIKEIEDSKTEEVEEEVKDSKVEEEPEIKIEEKKSFFSKFTKKLDEEKFNDMFEELELILIQNNVAYEAIEKMRDYLKEKLIGKSLKEVDLSTELTESIKSILINPPNFLETIKDSLKEESPFVIVFAGINGSGKTTTIAKVANYLKKNNLSVCVAASDTFRAAAIQQLEEHAKRLEIPIIKKDYGADPASVGFDAKAYAKKHKIDVVLIDTAGRMQNRDSLMKEMEKITRVTSPDMKIFLGESITGNDATEQARTFNETIDITGIILSKADVDEKGGTAISVSAVTGKPILFLGTGQNYEDLEIFNKDKLIEKLGL